MPDHHSCSFVPHSPGWCGGPGHRLIRQWLLCVIQLMDREEAEQSATCHSLGLGDGWSQDPPNDVEISSPRQTLQRTRLGSHGLRFTWINIQPMREFKRPGLFLLGDNPQEIRRATMCGWSTAAFQSSKAPRDCGQWNFSWMGSQGCRSQHNGLSRYVSWSSPPE